MKCVDISLFLLLLARNEKNMQIEPRDWAVKFPVPLDVYRWENQAIQEVRSDFINETFFCSVVVSLILQGLQFFFISREVSDVDIGFGWTTVFSIEFVSMESEDLKNRWQCLFYTQQSAAKTMYLLQFFNVIWNDER